MVSVIWLIVGWKWSNLRNLGGKLGRGARGKPVSVSVDDWACGVRIWRGQRQYNRSIRSYRNPHCSQCKRHPRSYNLVIEERNGEIDSNIYTCRLCQEHRLVKRHYNLLTSYKIQQATQITAYLTITILQPVSLSDFTPSPHTPGDQT